MAKRATPQPRKPPLRSVPKGSPANPVKPAEERESAKSNQADLETFHLYLGELKRHDAAIAGLRKMRKDCRRKASDAGLNLADLDLVMKMSEEEPETVQARITRLATYAYWAGLAPGTQPDLFKAADDKDDILARADHEGYVDGLEGATAEGDRYDPTTETGQARLKGWNRGQDVHRSRIGPIRGEVPPQEPDPAQTDIEDAAQSAEQQNPTEAEETQQVPEGATVQ